MCMNTKLIPRTSSPPNFKTRTRGKHAISKNTKRTQEVIEKERSSPNNEPDRAVGAMEYARRIRDQRHRPTVHKNAKRT